MKEKVIAIFDIGKSSKKIHLFNYDLKLIWESEEKIPKAKDDDGIECEDIDLIERWIRKSVSDLIRSDEWDLTAMNFTTYGASLVYIGSHGKRLAPLYSYDRQVDDSIPELLYNRYGGKDEFCRKTASPGMGMLNSGIQVLWLKNAKPDIFSKTRHIMHFPQYISYLFTGEIFSEHTSIGCHTALWDFDNMKYHKWVTNESLPLPSPVQVGTVTEVEFEGKKILAGIGINESSALLVPYFSFDKENFLLVSADAQCLSMNPFNEEKLTIEQLEKDCLCYLSMKMKPVKLSRFRLGYMHETALKKMSKYFKIQEDSFRLVKPDMKLFTKLSLMFRSGKIFINDDRFPGDIKEEPDFFEFDNFVQAYHQLMIELTDLTIEAINLVIPENNDPKNLYIKGDFSKNDMFVRLLASSFPHLRVFTSEISNATALGAALVIYDSVNPGVKPAVDLGLSDYSVSR